MFPNRILWLLFISLVSFGKHSIESPGINFSRAGEASSSSPSSSASGDPAQDALHLATLGGQYQDVEMYSEALKCFDRAIRKQPTEVKYYRQRISCHWEMGNYELAMADLQKVVEIDPQSKDDRLALSRALFDQGRYSDALEVILILDDIDELIALGEKIVGRRQYGEAVQYFTQIIQRKPDVPQLYKCRGDCYWEMKNFDMAISDYRAMVQTEPQKQEYRLLLSRALFDWGKPDEAVDAILAGGQRSVGSPRIIRKRSAGAVNADKMYLPDEIESQNDGNDDLEIMADELATKKRYDEAILCYTHLIERSTSIAHYYEARGTCYWKMKAYDMAVFDILSATKLDPNKEEYRSVLCKLLLDVGIFSPVAEESLGALKDAELESLGFEFSKKRKYPEAIRCYSEIINKNPLEKRYYKRRARCYLEMRDWDMTIADLRKLVQLDPEDRYNLISFGQALLDSGKFNNLEEDTLSFLSDTKLETLANELFKKGKYKEALLCYTEALKKNSKPLYYRRRGNCYSSMKDPQKALSEYKKAVEKDPSNEVNRMFLNEALFDSRILGGIPDGARMYVVKNYPYIESDWVHKLKITTPLELRETMFCRLIMSNQEIIVCFKITPTLRYILALTNNEELLVLADKFVSKEKYTEAIACYNHLIERSPSSALYYKARGMCYWKMRNHARAMLDFRNASKIDPNDEEYRFLLDDLFVDFEESNPTVDDDPFVKATYLVELGRRYQEKRKYMNALNCYDKAIERQPMVVDYYRQRVNCYWEIGDIRLAIDDLRKILEIDPKSRKDRLALSEALFDEERYSDALEEVLVLDDIDDLVAFGKKLFNAGQYNEAVRCFTEIMVKRANDSELYEWRARCFWGMQNFDMAISDYRVMVQLEPQNQKYEVLLTRALFDCGKFDEAVQAMLALNNDEELLGLANEFAFKEKYTEAITCYNHLIDRSPSNALYYKARGMCYWKMSNHARAMLDFRNAAKIDPKNQEYRSLLDDLFLDFKTSNKPIIDDDPFVRATYMAELGRRYQEEEKYSRALKYYNEAIKSQPMVVDFYRHRVGCYWEMGDTRRAMDDLRKILEIDPGSRSDRLALSEALFDQRRYFDALEVILVLDDIDDLVAFGKKLYIVRQYNEAIRCFTEIMKKEANNSQLYKWRARCFKETNNFYNAISDYRMMVQIEPQNKEHKLLLARALFDCGKFDEAVQVVNDNKNQLVTLADEFTSEAKYTEATLCYTHLIEKNSTEARFHHRRGFCYWKLKNYDMAIHDTRNAVKMNPNNAEYRSTLCDLFFDSGISRPIPEESLDVLRHAELGSLGLRFLRKKKYQEAICCYTHAIDKNSREKRYYKNRAACFMETKDWSMALSDLHRLLQLNPENVDHMNLFTKALLASGKLEDPTEDILGILNDTELEMLGIELSGMGKYNEAFRCYTEALKKNPKSTYYRHRGLCYLSMKNPKMAIDDFKNAVRVDPDARFNRVFFAEAVFDTKIFDEIPDDTLNILTDVELETLGNKFSSNAQYEEAFRCYSLAIEKKPGEATYYRRRGNCYRFMEKPLMAIIEYHRAVQVNPKDESCRFSFVETLYDYKEKFEEIPEEMLRILDDIELDALGNRFKSERKFEQALRCYNAAIEIRPESIYFSGRGDCYRAMYEYDLAISDYQEALKLDPSDRITRSHLTQALYNHERFVEIAEETFDFLTGVELIRLGIQFSNDEKFSEALRCYAQAIKKNPQPEHYRRRGDCYKNMKNLELAVSEYQKALQLDSKDRNTRLALFELFYYHERFNEISEENLNILTETELESMGREFEYEKKFIEAIRCYSMAIKKNPSEMDYYEQRGKCYWEIKDTGKAEVDFRHVLLMNPKKRESAKRLSEILFEAGRYNELIEDTFLLEEHEVMELAGKLFSIEKYNEALRCYNQALNKNPGDPMSFVMRGFCYWRMGKLEEAINDLNESVRWDPSNARYLFDLIDELLNAGRLEEAEKALTNLNEDSLEEQDVHRLDSVRKRIDKVAEEERLNKLLTYFEKLIIEDKESTIHDMIEETIKHGAYVENFVDRTSEVESVCEHYLQALKYSFTDYRMRKISDRAETSGNQESVTLFDGPEFLSDKITYELMADPVITPSGITYERESIFRHLQHNDTDPMSRLPLHEDQLIPNRAILEAVILWKKENGS